MTSDVLLPGCELMHTDALRVRLSLPVRRSNLHWHTLCLIRAHLERDQGESVMPTTKMRRYGYRDALRQPLCALITTIGASTSASAIEIAAGDWKFTANGNVNVHYIGL